MIIKAGYLKTKLIALSRSQLPLVLGQADSEAHALPALLLRNLGRMADAGVVPGPDTSLNPPRKSCFFMVRDSTIYTLKVLLEGKYALLDCE